ncbi:MAG: GNAT family N-acetyltransferase [Oscillospiraceae bacterium]|jgi:GNAT superfamily N-acetyltransferase|nr:GNAT family N-acetyltransferase [Oscillospiraceae bacterium]
MSATFRHYTPEPLFGGDYAKVRDFLIELDSHNYHFGRWDWMITHGWLDSSGLPKIGMWECGDRLVGLATYDCQLGKAYLLTLPGYESIKEDMLVYAADNLIKDGKFGVLILDGDQPMQDIAANHGYYPTQDKECDAVIPIGSDLSYTLPEGFRITSLKDTFDIDRYGRVLWKGFNHELNGEGPFVPKDEKNGKAGFIRPNVNLDLKIAVVAPNGDFVSYCGMWQDKRSKSALVEPVATDPDYRNMGLGKAAVLEAVKRCFDLGAERAFVGSTQQFYYSIGFRPYRTSTWWAKKDIIL